MSKTAFATKRGNPRFAFSAEAEILLGDGTTLPAQVFELSSHGCYIDAPQLIPVATQLRLTIFNGPSTCEVPGKIIYVHSGYGLGIYGMGVAFGEMAPEQRAELETWLRELAANERLKTSPQG